MNINSDCNATTYEILNCFFETIIFFGTKTSVSVNRAINDYISGHDYVWIVHGVIVVFLIRNHACD